MNTCDECKFFKIMDGYCRKHNVFRHSCGADACNDFELADDLKEIAKNTEQANQPDSGE